MRLLASASGPDAETQVQTISGVLSQEVADLLAGFQSVVPAGPIAAVTGDLLKDRMLLDTSIALGETIGMRQRLGACVFLYTLRLVDSEAHPDSQQTEPSRSTVTILVLLRGAGGTGRIVVQIPQLGEQDLTIEPGDAVILPARSQWRLPHTQGGSSRWLLASYASGSNWLDEASAVPKDGVRLWGQPAGGKWQDVSLPIRGKLSAMTIAVTARPLDLVAAGELFSGRTDTFHDLRVSLVHEPGPPTSAQHEMLALPLSGGVPLFRQLNQQSVLPPAAQGPLLTFEWATSPLLRGSYGSDGAGAPPQATPYLTGLKIEPSALAPGVRQEFPVMMGDRILLLRRGELETAAGQLAAPAMLFVPTGSITDVTAVDDVELLLVSLERAHVPLADPVTGPAGARVAFCIPIAPRRRTADWALASHLFNAALRSIHAQTAPNWIIVAVGSECPDINVPVDERFHFIASTRDVTDGTLGAAFLDGSNKRYLAEQRARELGADYLFFSDWDDLVHPDFVRFIRATRHPYGYVAGRGYMIDFERQDIAPFPTGPAGPSLDEISTSTLVFNAHALPTIMGGTEREISSHIRQRLLMHMSGRPLMELPFPAVAYMRYVTNNLSNMMYGEAPSDGTQLPPMRQAIVDNSLRNDAGIRADFGLDQLFESAPARQAPILMGPKRLSVLICTHRRPEGLAALLAQLVPQVARHTDREIIVVNDGTHDARYSTIIGSHGRAVRYLALPHNQGIARARNRAAELALGEYLVFTDDDCEVPPSWLDWVDASLKAYPELDAVAGFTRPLRPETASFMGRVQAAFDLLPRPVTMGEVDLSLPTACLALRASTFRRAGGFATGASYAIASEDTELAIRLARSGARIRLDKDWHVFHLLATSIAAEVRRFRRYGYGNRQIANMPLPPRGHLLLRGWRVRDMPSHFLRHYRNRKSQGDAYEGGWFEKRLARAVAALVATAYDYGAATNRPG